MKKLSRKWCLKTRKIVLVSITLSLVVFHWRLVIEMLLTPGSILELAKRRCLLGKNTLRLFPRVKQFTRLGGPAWQKTCIKNQKSALCWCG